MKSVFLGYVIWILFIMAFSASAQPIPDYYQRYSFLWAPSSAYEYGLVGFANPANLHFVNKFEAQVYWRSAGQNSDQPRDWGIFTGTPGLGFGMLRQHPGEGSVTDYKISTAFGKKSLALGLAYGWSSGATWDAMREKLVTVGSVIRPFSHLSLGLVAHFSLQSGAREGVAEIGLRPLGTPLLTLFADGAMQNGTVLADAPWSAGVSLQPIKGVSVVGRYFSDKAFTVGFTFQLGGAGVASLGSWDSNGDYAATTYMVRTGGCQPSFFSTMFRKNKLYVPMDLKGRVAYLDYRFSEKGVHRFYRILANIQAAKRDPRVHAIALNLSRTRITPENAWEIREALKDFRQSGKKVVVFLDNAGMTLYHLASVADKIVMDPEGSLMLPGYIMGRTYLKGTLEKLGLGFEEWRFFKYKSAAEALSRENMSDADREQRQAYLDDWYELVRADVCEARSISPQKFDDMIDNHVYFMSPEAIEAGLVDTLGRWSQREDLLKALTGRELEKVSTSHLLDNAVATQQWGELPRIAIVYALGVCDVDKGIRARWLEKKFLKLAKDKSVKAVVFRVDSPGGDGMASDMVAEALKKCSEKKPVIISQGQVAASGGYWISMYGDEIVAGPNTITGSIGVIGGWLYDKGISQKMGMTSDFVKRGKHADMGFGVTLPFLGLTIPARNLTEEEYHKMEHYIKAFYDIFVKKVAQGRGLSVERVRQIAEGRIYSGLDGQQVKLVDEIGGLLTAIAIARQKAGIPLDKEISIVEYPRYKGFFPNPLKGVSAQMNPQEEIILEYLRMLSEHPGKPLPMLPPGSYPVLEQ